MIFCDDSFIMLFYIIIVFEKNCLRVVRSF